MFQRGLGIRMPQVGLHVLHARDLCHAGLVALHGFIKKTRATPDEDLALARKRKKELEQ